MPNTSPRGYPRQSSTANIIAPPKNTTRDWSYNPQVAAECRKQNRKLERERKKQSIIDSL